MADDEWDSQRLALYHQGRDTLLAAGYRQLSMRHFRRADLPVTDEPDYCCQTDGMVGLGCGARSYTGSLHYSFDYAVGVGQVRAIIEDYLRRPADDFTRAEVGFWLDAVEQRRRWLVKSLLRADGFAPAVYRDRFGTDAGEDFPQLDLLARRGWLQSARQLGAGTTGEWSDLVGSDRVALTPAGLARSDVIGPWLVSGPVRAAMSGYALR